MTTLRCTSPVDGSLYCERPFASDGEINKVLERASKVKSDWAQRSYAERAEHCRRAIDFLVKHADQIGKELTWQMGRPIRYTPGEIKGGMQERAHYMIEHGSRFLEDISIQDDHTALRKTRRVPLGTVLVLAPWNYPFLTAVNAIIPALLAGNTVILKHAEQTPLVAERWAEAFQNAGLPHGVFQYLHMTHHQVGQMISDSRIARVSFTGSVGGGLAIQLAAHKRFIGVGLELGGKDAAFVCKDADVERAASGIVDGAFFNSGQSCCGIERVYVHQDLLDDFVTQCIAITKEYALGNPTLESTTLGPVVRPEAGLRIMTQVSAAIKAGAKPLIDADHFPHMDLSNGYLAPQILMDVHHGMDVMQEETFGPVMGIMSVSSEEEAIQLINDSRYGLTASIWTNDRERAADLATQIEAGTVFMNRCDYLDPALAWTGIKDSGRGSTLSSLGMHAFTRPQSLHFRN